MKIMRFVTENIVPEKYAWCSGRHSDFYAWGFKVIILE